MLKAKLDSARKNKKGFSLVELIIVMAIMVALVAVMAPQFIKYVQRSRDAVVTDACENILSCVKTEIALGHISGYGNIEVKTNTAEGANNGKLIVAETSMKADSTLSFAQGTEYSDFSGFLFTFCGVDSGKSTKTQVIGTININSAGVATLTYQNAAK